MSPTKTQKAYKGTTAVPRIPQKDIIEYKEKIVALLEDEEVVTLTDAARYLELSPSRIRGWMKADEEFAVRVAVALEVIPDKLERKLLASPNIIAQIFMLKGLRHKYKDNYRMEVTADDKTKEVLQKLLELGKEKDQRTPEQQAAVEEDENPFKEIIKNAEKDKGGTQ